MRKLLFHRSNAVNEDTAPVAAQAAPAVQAAPAAQSNVAPAQSPVATAQAPAASATQNAAVFSQSIANLRGLIDSVPTLTAVMDSYSKGNHADVVQKMTQFNQKIPATVINSAMSSMTQILELYGQCTANFNASRAAVAAQQQAAQPQATQQQAASGNASTGTQQSQAQATTAAPTASSAAAPAAAK